MDAEDEAAVGERNEVIEAYNAVAMENEEVKIFRESIENDAFKMACKLNANMILPRDLVYRTIIDFEKFIKTNIVDGN